MFIIYFSPLFSSNIYRIQGNPAVVIINRGENFLSNLGEDNSREKAQNLQKLLSLLCFFVAIL